MQSWVTDWPKASLKRAKAELDTFLRESKAKRAESALVLAALGAALYVVVYPFLVVTYPPITDLPFHAAETSIFRHYFDPAWHFREQFTLHPFDAPYLSMYLVGRFSRFSCPSSPLPKRWLSSCCC